MLSERALTRRHEGLDIRGVIPVITPLFGPSYASINETIEEVVSHLIRDARQVRARTVTFHHEVYDTEDLVSVLVYATVSALVSRTWVRSINFNPESGEFLTINEAMGLDIIPLADRILTELTRRDVGRFYAALSISLEEQSFYLTDEKLVFLFDEFQLSTEAEGVTVIELTLANIRSTTISEEDYRVRDDIYNLQMIPIRHVLERLGYRVIFVSETRTVEISRRSQLLIAFRNDANDYHITGVQQRSLEAAPLIENGVTYVPITFFDQIMPLATYSIDAEGNITFLVYLDF
jgi:hypothetical protein